MDLDQPVATTEFLVVDTETNGLAGDACELTEVGAVLVGGGELHERWETLLTVRTPLSRGIQRFTGITQAMVDEAPPAEAQLPELAAQLRGRVLVAHSASFDRRVLRQAFDRAGEGDGLELYFGATSGALFASGDAGGSWSAVAEHLPPVYSVRTGRSG